MAKSLFLLRLRERLFGRGAAKSTPSGTSRASFSSGCASAAPARSLPYAAFRFLSSPLHLHEDGSGRKSRFDTRLDSRWNGLLLCNNCPRSSGEQFEMRVSYVGPRDIRESRTVLGTTYKENVCPTESGVVHFGDAGRRPGLGPNSRAAAGTHCVGAPGLVVMEQFFQHYRLEHHDAAGKGPGFVGVA